MERLSDFIDVFSLKKMLIPVCNWVVDFLQGFLDSSLSLLDFKFCVLIRDFQIQDILLSF